MGFFNEEQIKDIKEIFSNLINNIEIIFFGQDLNCSQCKDTENLLEELCNIDEKLSFKAYNFVNDIKEVKKYLITDIPAIVIRSSLKDFGIVYYGIPSGYEFNTLLQTIVYISRDDHGLSSITAESLQYINTPVIIKVFVTPNCPHCPQAAIMAFRFAMANDYIGAYVYESSEFPHLVQRYNVKGVPKIVFNEDISIEGAVPESVFLKNALKSAENTGSSIPSMKSKCDDNTVCEIEDGNFQKEVIDSDIPVLIDFYADWCNPCKMLAPTINKLKQIYKDKAKILKMNTDNNPIVSQKYNIRSIPTIIIFNNGDIHQIISGLRPINDYKNAIDTLL